MRIPRLLVICLTLIPFGSGCRPPIRIVCDVAGTREPVYARDGAFKVATFKGSGMWEVLAVAKVVIAGEEGPRKVERQYRPSDDTLEIRLEDFLATELPSVEGRYSFSFSIPEIMAEQTLPQGVVVLDRTPPTITCLTAQGSGAPLKEPLADGTKVFLQERSLRILVEDETACEVTINGEKALPDADGVYALDPQDTAPLIEAVDRSGNRRSCRPLLSVDLKEPVIQWPEGLQKVVFRPDLALEMKVEDDGVLERVIFRLGGKEIAPQPLPGGRYTASLTLEPGDNVLQVEALDGAHRRASSERKIRLETTKVSWTIAGTRGVAYTRDGQHRVARFEGPGDWQVSAVSAFVPAARSTPQEIQRDYRPSGGQLDIFLDDFCLDEKVPSEGRYRFTFTVSGPKIATEETPTSVVILDRTPPMLFVEVTGNGGEVIERPAGEETEIAASGERVRVRIGDDSPPCEVKAAGKSLLPERDGVLVIPLGDTPVELTAADAAGNRAAWKLRRPPPADTQVPLATAVPRGKAAQDAASEASPRRSSSREHVSAVPALASIETGASKTAVSPGSTAVLPPGSTGALPPRAKTSETPAAPSKTGREAENLDAAYSASTVSREPKIHRESGRFVLLLEDAGGRSERWALPSAVRAIEPIPGLPGNFRVTTSREQGVAMALVPGGFPLGGGKGRSTPYLMECFEVTVERFERFRQAASPRPMEEVAPEFRAPGQPVVIVSWDEAVEFATWADKSLPSALEHEAASSWDGSGRRRFPWGDEFEAGGIALEWQSRPPPAEGVPNPGDPAARGSGDARPRDVSAWGIVGLAGGVREWCLDVPEGKPEHRVIRGGSVVHPRGSWGARKPITPEHFLTSRQDSALRSSKMNDVGVRCVMRLQRAAAVPVAESDTGPEGGR